MYVVKKNQNVHKRYRLHKVKKHWVVKSGIVGAMFLGPSVAGAEDVVTTVEVAESSLDTIRTNPIDDGITTPTSDGLARETPREEQVRVTCYTISSTGSK